MGLTDAKRQEIKCQQT